MSKHHYVLKVICPNRPGIVAAVSTLLFQNGCNILEAHQFDDTETSRFFMRLVFNFTEGGSSIEAVREGFAPIAERFAMEWSIQDSETRQRVLLMVSRFDHCLADILYNWRSGELKMDITGIISNHPRETYAHLDFEGIPFHHLPITKDTKAEQEARIWKVVEETGPRPSSSPATCRSCPTIFRPSWPGAASTSTTRSCRASRAPNPITRPHARGVKLIGATAHYVTADLDEGPIIEQDVERISHHETAEDLVRKGRDIERRVLTRACRSIWKAVC